MKCTQILVGGLAALSVGVHAGCSGDDSTAGDVTFLQPDDAGTVTTTSRSATTTSAVPVTASTAPVSTAPPRNTVGPTTTSTSPPTTTSAPPPTSPPSTTTTTPQPSPTTPKARQLDKRFASFASSDDRRWNTVSQHASDAAFALARAHLRAAATHYSDGGAVLHRMIVRANENPLSRRAPLGRTYVDTVRMCRAAYNTAGEELRRLAAHARANDRPDTSAFDAATQQLGRCSARVDRVAAALAEAR